MPGFSTPDRYDLIICGAGPGGSAAALTLKSSGLRIALLDKTDFPRDKICGDALSGKVVSVLRYIDPALVDALHQFEPKTGCYGIRFFSPARECLDIPFKKNLDELEYAPGFVTKRIDFDHFLHQQCLASEHVDWFPHHPVKLVEVHEDGVKVYAGDRVFEGAVVIGADGAHSVVNKSLGLRNIDKHHHSAGVRAYVTGVTGFHERQFIELHFLKDLLPGYFWIFPLPNGGANVGLGMLSSDLAKTKVNLREKLEEIIHSHPEITGRFENARIEGPIMGFGLPLGSRRLPISSSRCMLVGDAASLIDPFTGEGIGNAMISGRVAAQTLLLLLEKGDFSTAAFQAYDEAIYKKVGQELRISKAMQNLVNYPWLFDFFARKANRNASLQLLLTMMFESLDLRKELIRPSFYWNLLFGGSRKTRKLQQQVARETMAKQT
ncbi:MAG: geranylgeranyl reductase family protein [Bacteroidia bacterium]|nr:geranylgeranyl reductase family protein [Bacteroidia bacterium]